MRPVVTCPQCGEPQVLVPGVNDGVCGGCRRYFSVKGNRLEIAGDDAWPSCDGRRHIGAQFLRGNSTYTVFAATDWVDLCYDWRSTELFLMNDAGDEISLEYEKSGEDDGGLVWWIDTDITPEVTVVGDKLSYRGKPYRRFVDGQYNPSGNPFRYQARSCAGVFDECYGRDEIKQVSWYVEFAGGLDTRLGRIGRTTEFGKETFFWMAPAAEPALPIHPQVAEARRAAFTRQNLPTILMTLMAAAAAVFVHLGLSFGVEGKAQVYDSGVINSVAQRHWVSDPFEVRGRASPVRVTLDYRTNNTWFDLSLCLASTQSSTRYCVPVSADEISATGPLGGRETADISGVPPGTYVAEGQVETDKPAPTEFRVTLDRGVVRHTNLWITLALLIGLPLLAIGMRKAQEYVSRDPKSAASAAFMAVFIVFWLFIMFVGDFDD